MEVGNVHREREREGRKGRIFAQREERCILAFKRYIPAGGVSGVDRWDSKEEL